MEYVARDEDGHMHVGWVQDQDNSCGPASIYTVEMTLKQACLTDGEKRIRQLLNLYFSQGILDRFDRMLNDFNTRGIGMGQLAKALNAEGFPCSMTSSLPSPIGNAKFPFIAHIAWPSQAGHFIVVAGVTSTSKLVCLDPWYGMQQISLKSMPAYTAACSQQARCSTAAGGTFSGWCILLT